MEMIHLAAPDLVPLATGGATLQLLEALDFSRDGRSLLVRATFTDDADPGALRHGAWVYDLGSRQYTRCLNVELAASPAEARLVDVGQATFVDGSRILAGSRLAGGPDEARLLMVGSAGSVTDVLAAILGSEVVPRIERHAVSADGRFLAIQTDSALLAPVGAPDTNEVSDVYLFDLVARRVDRVSVIGGSEVAAGVTLGNVVVQGGRVQVAFASDGVFSTKDGNSRADAPADAYLWSCAFGEAGLAGSAAVTLASAAPGGAAAGAVVAVEGDAAVLASPAGVLFNSASADLVAGDTNGAVDAFLRTAASETTLLSLEGLGVLAGGARVVAVSASGRIAALLSDSAEVVRTPSAQQLVLLDLKTGDWKAVSYAGTQPADDFTFGGALSANGALAAFTSTTANLPGGASVALGGDLFVVDTGFEVNAAPGGSVSISGQARQGQALAASNTLADADGLGAVSYQWYADGAAIAGATASSLVLGQAQVGKAITAVASYTDGYGTLESLSSAATAAVANVNDAPAGQVAITGVALQGQALTASNTLADADGLGAVSYQWYAAGVAIGGADAATLTLTQAQVGKAITVSASYVDGYGTAESVGSAATAPVVNVNDKPTGQVLVTGTAVQGQALAASHTLADADGLGPVGYQWFADGVAIAGANSANLLLTQALVGKSIGVAASYLDGFAAPESVAGTATGPVANVDDKPTGQVTIAGAAVPGQTLSASNTLADADGMGPLSYQWYAAGVAVEGATGASLALTEAQLGKAISVVASYVDGYGNPEAVSSAATAAVKVPGGSVGGLVYQWKTHALLPGVGVGFTGLPAGSDAAALSDTTGGDGAFAVEDLPQGSLGLVASKGLTAAETGSVISSADALAALRIAVGRNPNADPDGAGPLGPPPVSPYQFLAADVNQDGRVTSADALAILRMAVKRSGATPREWLFVSETEDFWNEAGNGGQGEFTTTRLAVGWHKNIEVVPDGAVTQNLVAVLKGDVNASWAPSGGAASILPDSHFLGLQAAGIGPVTQWGMLAV